MVRSADRFDDLLRFRSSSYAVHHNQLRRRTGRGSVVKVKLIHHIVWDKDVLWIGVPHSDVDVNSLQERQKEVIISGRRILNLSQKVYDQDYGL